MAQLASKLDDFGRNTGATVKTFSTIVERTGLQLSSSNELLKKVENLDLAKVSGANLKVLRSLESMMDTFNAFPAYYNELNGSLNATTSLIKELSALNERSRSFTEVLENLTQGVKASKDANEFFSRNIQSFADYSDVVNRAVESTSRSMNQAIALLEESALNAFERINQSVEIHDQNLRHSFQLAIDHYNTVAKTQVEIIRNLQSTYLEVFKPLQEIPKLLNSVEGLGKANQNNHIELLELLKKHLGELGSLKRIDGNFNSNMDYDRLEEIFSRALSRSKPNEGAFDIVLKISLLCASVSLFLYLVFLSLQQLI
jgi:hypothetical protein